MHWADISGVVFVRDFAYPRPQRRRLRIMTSTASDIAGAPARVFAEYVLAPSPSGAPSRPRKALPYRVLSHHLRTQVHAKTERARLLSGPLVDVVVGAGDRQRRWNIHRNLLCHHSDRLATALQEADCAADGRAATRLVLAEDDPEGFVLLVKYLYQGKLDDGASVSGAEARYAHAAACQKLYMLCERFDMPGLKNLAIDEYRKGLYDSRLVPDADEIFDMYATSPPHSPLRALIIRIAARQIMDPDADRDASGYRRCFAAGPDFAVDLVNAIKSGTNGVLFDDPTTGDNCAYHSHDHGPDCYGAPKVETTGNVNPT